MTLVLDYWRIRWFSVAFDKVDGVGRIRWLSRKPKRCNGWANKNRGNWFAIWNSNHGLVFQSGKELWELKKFNCEYKSKGREGCLLITNSFFEVFKIKFNLSIWNDEDKYELEVDNFFYWVSVIWNDPDLQRELANKWGLEND